MGRERQGTETGQYRTGLQAWRDGFGYEAAEFGRGWKAWIWSCGWGTVEGFGILLDQGLLSNSVSASLPVLQWAISPSL